MRREQKARVAALVSLWSHADALHTPALLEWASGQEVQRHWHLFRKGSPLFQQHCSRGAFRSGGTGLNGVLHVHNRASSTSSQLENVARKGLVGAARVEQFLCGKAESIRLTSLPSGFFCAEEGESMPAPAQACTSKGLSLRWQ
jgi:hypothetical protein